MVRKLHRGEGSSVLLSRNEAGEFDRVVMAEVLIPNVPNVFGDIYSEENIRDIVEKFAVQGYGLDINHDQKDVEGKDYVVIESFIARPGDPDFIVGSWVVGIKVLSDTVWQRILDGDLNGFSYEAEAEVTEITLQHLRNRQVVGTTEPDPFDGHTHDYLVIVSPLNRPIAGATGETNGHSHKIVTHTVTEDSLNDDGRFHSHRYQVIVLEDSDNAG